MWKWWIYAGTIVGVVLLLGTTPHPINCHQVGIQCTTLNAPVYAWVKGNFPSPEALTAYATAILALFTYTLWRATTAQGRVTLEALKLARDEFNATHRPKLILRQAWSLISDWEDATIVVTYTVTNVGETRCWMTACHVGVEVVSELKYPLFVMTPDMSFPSNVPFIGAIAPGEAKQFQYVDKNHRWTLQNRQEFPDLAGVHFVGHITYVDEPGSNVKRSTAFRWKYEIETQRFHRIFEVGSEHEYAD